MAHRDIVVIGASTGGLPPLVDIIRHQPAGLRAALFVVMHTAPEGNGLLSEILERHGAIPSHYARDGEPIRHGQTYVAPPDHHLLIKGNQVRVARGPRENRFRPAIDPLFRTAALNCGPRVIGVILSGGLNDGTRGIELIKQYGGLAIAQDPEEAVVPSMPMSAIRNGDVDYILTAHNIARRLPRLVSESVEEWEGTVASQEPDVAEGTSHNMRLVSGPPSEYTCPECGGTLWEMTEGRVLRYRCHVGHGYTADSLIVDQSAGLENVLSSALRALEEQSMLRRRIAKHARQSGAPLVGRENEREARRSERRAAEIRQLLHQGVLTGAGTGSAHSRSKAKGESRPSALTTIKTKSSRQRVDNRSGTRTRRVNP